jgi:hypothetical protein
MPERIYFSDPDDSYTLSVGEPYIGSDGEEVAAFDPGSPDTVTIRRVLSEFNRREIYRLSTEGPGIAADVPDPAGGTRSVNLNVNAFSTELLLRCILSWTFTRSNGEPVPLTRQWIEQIGPLGAWLEQAISAYYARRGDQRTPATEAARRDFTNGSGGPTRDEASSPNAPETSSSLNGSATATPIESSAWRQERLTPSE